MNQLSASSLASQIRNRSRSMGLKLLLVSALALLMMIPAILVSNVVEERTNRAQSVIQEIGGRAGGPQTFLGPTLAIPYSVSPQYKAVSPGSGMYVVFSTKGDAALKVRTQERHRSLALGCIQRERCLGLLLVVVLPS